MVFFRKNFRKEVFYEAWPPPTRETGIFPGKVIPFSNAR